MERAQVYKPLSDRAFLVNHELLELSRFIAPACRRSISASLTQHQLTVRTFYRPKSVRSRVFFGFHRARRIRRVPGMWNNQNLRRSSEQRL